MLFFPRATKNILLLAIVVALNLSGCEEDEGSKESDGSNLNPQGFNNSGCNPQQVNNTSQFSQEGLIVQGSYPQEDVNFNLQSASVTYEADIKPILKGRCFDSCHNGSQANVSNWSGTDGSIEYAEIANIKTFIGNVVNGSLSHSDPLNLSTDEIAKFEAWAKAGFPRGSETQDPAVTGNPAVPSTGAMDPCTGNSGLPDQTPAIGGGTSSNGTVEALVNSELHKSCQAEKTMTDRKNDKCLSEVPLDMSWCNDAGIKAKFDELAQAGKQMAEEITKFKGQGYELEGCGVHTGNKKPYVSWLKRGQDQILFHIHIGTPPGG